MNLSDKVNIIAIIIAAALTGIGWVIAWNPVAKGISSVVSKFDSWQYTLPYTTYHTTPAFRTDGQGGSIESNALGSILVDQQTMIFGEDPINNVMKIQSQGTYREPLTVSAQVKDGMGQLFGFVVNSADAGATIKIWDSNNSTGTVMFDTMTFNNAAHDGPRVVAFPAAVKFFTGCYFTISGTISVTPIWN
jgi:hypothetical protein